MLLLSALLLYWFFSKGHSAKQSKGRCQGKIKSFHSRCAGAGHFSLLVQRKGNQKKARPGRDPSGYARRFPALLAERGDGAQLASLKHVRLFAPRSAAVLGSLYGGGSQKPKSKSNRNSKNQSQSTPTQPSPSRHA